MTEAKQSGRGRPSTFPLDDVVAVAMQAYWSEGPEAMSLNEICRRAGVSKPGLYRSLGGEDALLDAALARYADVVLARNMSAVDLDAPLSQVLETMFESFTDVDRPGPAGCLLARLQHSIGLGPAVAARVEALRQQARDVYGSLIDAAKARGEVDTSIPTEVAAAMIDTMCNAVLAGMAAGEDPELLRSQALLAVSCLR